MNKNKMAYHLASLACNRAKLQHAISTAHACGDSEYVRNNKDRLYRLDRRINALVNVLPSAIIQEYHEITNAPL